jgi:O-antigen/teichoic acid export membrane protein
MPPYVMPAAVWRGTQRIRVVAPTLRRPQLPSIWHGTGSAEVPCFVDGEETPGPEHVPGQGPVPEQGAPDEIVPSLPPESHNASKRQILRNMVSSYANLIVGMAMGLILTRVLLHHLGAGGYGLWIVLVAIVGYIGLLDVGVATAVVQKIARLMADDERQGIADVIRTAWMFFAVSGALAVLVTVVLAPFLSSILHLGTISPTVAGITLILLGVMTAIMFIGSVPNSVLFGSGRSDRVAQIGLIGLFVTQLGQIVAVILGAGLIGLAAVVVVGVTTTLVLATVMVRRITGASIGHGHFNRALLVELLRFGGRQFFVSLGGTVAYDLDAVIIGLILPVAQVAPYDIALSTANLTRSLSTQGTDLLLPAYSHFDAVGDGDAKEWFFSRSVMGGLAISVPVVIAVAAFGDPILNFWLGTVPPKTYEIVIALGIMMALQLPGHQCFIFLTGIGRNKLLARLAISGAVVNLAGSVGATFWLGPIGPAIGSLPVVLVLDFIVLPVIVCRCLGIRVRHYARTALLPVVPGAAVAGGVALLLIHLHPEHSGIAAIVEAVIVVVASWIALIVVVAILEPAFRRSVLARLRRH